MNLILSPLRELYDWMLSLGGRPYALFALAALAFAESILFPLPLEILLLPMILGARQRVVLFVVVAALFSAVGAVVGAALAQGLLPLLEVLHLISAENQDSVQRQFDRYGSWAVAVGALTPLPFKVTVIVAGLAQYNLLALFGFSLVFRGLRYGLVGLLAYVFGAQIKGFIDRWFGWLCLLGLGIVGLLVWYVTNH